MQSSKIFINYTLKVNRACQKDINTELDINDIKKGSLDELVKILNELSHSNPRLAFLILRIKGRGRAFWQTPVEFVFDYLCRETELHVIHESSPVINDYDEKIENGHYEDGSILFFGNIHSFDNFQESYIDSNSIYVNKLWIDLYYSVTEFSSYASQIIDCDIHELFNYSHMISALKKPIKVFGGPLKDTFEFVSKAFKIDKTSKEVPNKLLFIGGKCSDPKIRFILNSRMYFKTIYLTGELGLLYSLFKCGININDHLNDWKSYFVEFEKIMKEAAATLLYSREYFVASQDTIREINSMEEDKSRYLLSVKTSLMEKINFETLNPSSVTILRGDNKEFLLSIEENNENIVYQIIDQSFEIIKQMTEEFPTCESCIMYTN